MPEDWTEEEVTTIIEDYFSMLSKDIRGAKYSKTEHRRNIIEKLNNRTHGSIEFKHQNISAILCEFNHPFIEGYKPYSNYQALLKTRVVDYLNKNDKISEVVESEPSPILIPSEKIRASSAREKKMDPFSLFCKGKSTKKGPIFFSRRRRAKIFKVKNS